VPTWNYVVVHAHGPAKIYEDRDWLLRNVRELTDSQERNRAEPWGVGDAPVEYIDRLLNAIVGVEIPIARLTGKWKASQHRSTAETAKVIEALNAEGDAAAEMAAVMSATLR
jgi:transcriptional regulator